MKKGIDLGCGMRKKASTEEISWQGMDIRPFAGVDVVCDLGSETYPFADATIDECFADNVFEHFDVAQLFHCLDETWRILKPDGKLTVIVPKSGTGAWYAHPDHKMHFIEDSFAFYQVPSTGIDGHGYLTHFWHVTVTLIAPQMIQAEFYPNKPGNPYYPYKEVKRADEE